ncbi:MAG: MarR family transcriptional regulator [Mycobacterium sp.]
MVAHSPSTPLLMFVAHRAAEGQVFEALRATGFDDLTLAQCRMAQRLSPSGIRLTELAEQARITKQTAGALVDELERSGYVTRQPDPTDARARLVVLTDRGAHLCRAAAAEVAQIETQWRRHLGARAYRQLSESLVALRDITDPYR